MKECKYTTYVVLGAGPAGIQLSYFFMKAGIEHILVERSETAGSFFQKFPRHRRLISINKVHTGTNDPEKNLRWDWNSLLSDEDSPLLTQRCGDYFPQADEYVAYLEDYVAHHNLDVVHGFDVTRVERVASSSDAGSSPREGFRLTSGDGRSIECHRLIVATGLSQDWAPPVPGAEHCESYGTVSVDPEDFAGQRVLIVGKGNSAFETADNLIATAASIHLASPSPLRMAWQTHFVGHLRAVNNNFLDTYQLKSQNAVLDATIRRIQRADGRFLATFEYAHANQEVEVLEYDRVILCTGFRFNAEAFHGECEPELTDCGRLPRMTSSWESTNVPDLFFAGALMQYRDYKRYMSAFIHGFRYNVRALARMLEARYHRAPWPSKAVRLTAPDVTALMLARINRSSAIWQQPGFLCDILCVDGGRSSADYHEEMPVDYAKEHHFCRGRWLQITLEYGNNPKANPFEFERVHRQDVHSARDSTFLHPIVRYVANGTLIAEHHVLEDLAAEWQEPEHIEPLTEFVEAVLERPHSFAESGASHPAPALSGFSPTGEGHAEPEDARAIGERTGGQ